MSYLHEDDAAIDVQATLIAPGTAPQAVAKSDPQARPELLVGTRPRLEGETRELLRIRLIAVASILLAAVSLFLVRDLFLLSHPSLTSRLVMTAVLGTSISLLVFRRELTMFELRVIEAGTFAAMALYLVVYEYELVVIQAEAGNPAFQLGAIKSCLLYSFATMILYGAYIPNTWQRSLYILIPVGLAPFIALGALHLTSAEFCEIDDQLSTFEQISTDLIVQGVGIFASALGAHIIHTLRLQEFEARQMGQYLLIERIGAGGMGEVFRAEHALLKRPCAIKLIRPGEQADRSALARFEREVRTTAGLTHWNTINVYDYGRTADGTFFYVMEYLSGMSLGQLVERYGPLPASRAIFLLRQACRALVEAHGAGLVHRDIKPANLFVTEIGGLCDTVKLLDFGLVYQQLPVGADSQKFPGELAGTPLYMSPEQAAGLPLDARSDLYSLGATAYFAVTGQPPFSRADVYSLLEAHLDGVVKPPSQRNPDVPRDLEAVIMRCLSKRPGGRPESALQLEHELAACAAADGWNDDHAAEWWTRYQPHRIRALAQAPLEISLPAPVGVQPLLK